MTIGDKIKRLREEMGLTQDEVATAVDTTPQNIYKYEKGIISNIPLAKIEKLASLFGVTPWELAGWEGTAPVLSENLVEFPVIGEIAAGFDHIALEDSQSAHHVEIPASYLKGRPRSDFFVLRVCGDSMYPLYMDGDNGAVLYEDYATLKKVEYVTGEDWMRLVPVNPTYQPKMIEGADLEQCRILGVPVLLIREVE